MTRGGHAQPAGGLASPNPGLLTFPRIVSLVRRIRDGTEEQFITLINRGLGQEDLGLILHT